MFWNRGEDSRNQPNAVAMPNADELIAQIQQAVSSIRGVAADLDDVAKTPLALAALDTEKLLYLLDTVRPSNRLTALTSLQDQIGTLAEAASQYWRIARGQFTLRDQEQRMQAGRQGFAAVVLFLVQSQELIQSGALAEYERHVQTLQASKFAALIK